MAKHITIIALQPYNDLELKRLVKAGEHIEVLPNRAYAICSAGLAQIYSILTY
jgi:hypothetical protein